MRMGESMRMRECMIMDRIFPADSPSIFTINILHQARQCVSATDGDARCSSLGWKGNEKGGPHLRHPFVSSALPHHDIPSIRHGIHPTPATRAKHRYSYYPSQHHTTRPSDRLSAGPAFSQPSQTSLCLPGALSPAMTTLEHNLSINFDGPASFVRRTGLIRTKVSLCIHPSFHLPFCCLLSSAPRSVGSEHESCMSCARGGKPCCAANGE